MKFARKKARVGPRRNYCLYPEGNYVV